MTANELINILKSFDPNAKVKYAAYSEEHEGLPYYMPLNIIDVSSYMGNILLSTQEKFMYPDKFLDDEEKRTY